MPLTMAAFTVASIGIAGMPFMVGFVSKMSIIEGAAEIGQPFFIVTLMASALLSLTYLVPVCYIAFSKRNINADFLDYPAGTVLEGEANKAMLIPLLLTACISILLGIMLNAGPPSAAVGRNGRPVDLSRGWNVNDADVYQICCHRLWLWIYTDCPVKK